MNSQTQKIMLGGLVLLLSACAPYPHHYYSSYPSHQSGYTVKRSYYGAPLYYPSYSYPTPHYQYYQYNVRPGWGYRYVVPPYRDHWREEHHDHHDRDDDHDDDHHGGDHHRGGDDHHGSGDHHREEDDDHKRPHGDVEHRPYQHHNSDMTPRFQPGENKGRHDRPNSNRFGGEHGSMPRGDRTHRQQGQPGTHRQPFGAH